MINGTRIRGVARLVYVSDDMPGISRRRAGSGFVYLDRRGQRVAGPATLARIRALAVPPAWRSVWICPDAMGHLQATGRDARGRKQYRYHDEWRRVRDQMKYDRVLDLADHLPAIRRRVSRDIRQRGLSRDTVVALVVQLLEATLVRVGNDEYVRENGSFGLTTLRPRHVEVTGDTIRLRFRGKSGARHSVAISDLRLARLVRRCIALPGGGPVFRYLDDAGEPRVDSQAVNHYLRRITGEDFTAKDFRTWHGTVMAAWALKGVGPSDTKAQAKRSVARAVEEVAARLGQYAGDLSGLLYPPRAHLGVPRWRPRVHGATVGPRKDIGAECHGGPRGAPVETAHGPSRIREAIGSRSSRKRRGLVDYAPPAWGIRYAPSRSDARKGETMRCPACWSTKTLLVLSVGRSGSTGH